MSNLLGCYNIRHGLTDKRFEPAKVYVYDDKIEIELWKLNPSKEARLCLKAGCSVVGDAKYQIRIMTKKFDYRDLLLMSATLNKIMRSENEKAKN
jgi:hypothetical protein